MLKKITTYFLSLCFIITPIFLTGCIDTDPESENSVYNSYDGMKISYKTDFSGVLTDEQKSYLQDMEYQIDAMAQDIMFQLSSEYGVGIDDLGAGTLTVLSDSGETYAGADSANISYNITPLANKTTFEPFNADAFYDTETHYNAIQADGVGWNWKIENTAGVTVAPLDASYHTQFSLEHEENLKIAIGMILAGYEIYDTASDDYQIFLDHKNAVATINYSDLVKEIDHLGLTKLDRDNISSFILNVVIGDALKAAETSRFFDANGNGIFDADEYIDLSDDGSYTADLTGIAERYDDTTGATPDNGIYDGDEDIEDYDGSLDYTLDLTGYAELYNDLNENGSFDGGAEYRFDDFKNYKNTVDVIVDRIYQNANYPQILAVEFMDVNFANYIPSETTDFPDTVARSYNSIVFDNKVPVQTGWIYFMLESDYTFDLEVYVNYYDGADFYSELTNTVAVEAGSYDDITCEFEVDFEKATFTENQPLSLESAFENNTTAITPSALYKNHLYLDKFNTQELLDGSALTINYNDTATSFYEVYFNIVPSVENLGDDITFKFSILAIDY